MVVYVHDKIISYKTQYKKQQTMYKIIFFKFSEMCSATAMLS